MRELRNESTVRQAIERVSGIRDRLNEIFFWFDGHSTESQKAIGLISRKDYRGALSVLEGTGQATTDWLGQKNMALALLFDAFANSSLDSLRRSLESWKRISQSEAFWSFYERHYLLHDELGTSASIFEEFRRSIPEILAVRISAFYCQTKNPLAIGAYYSVLVSVGKAIDIEVIQPTVLKIKSELDAMEMIKQAPGAYAELINRSRRNIGLYFLELDRFELSGYSPLTVLKEDTAEKLRSVAVCIHNRDDDFEIAIILLNQGLKLATSAVVIDRIESDRRQILKNRAWAGVSVRFASVERLIENGSMAEARCGYLALDDELSRHLDDAFRDIRVRLLIDYCSQVVAKGTEFLEQHVRKTAVLAFEQAADILKDRLHLLSFVDSDRGRKAFCKSIETMSFELNRCDADDLIDLKQSYMIVIEEEIHRQSCDETQIAMKYLALAAFNCIVHRRIGRAGRTRIWMWIGWWGALAVALLFGLANDKPKVTKKASSAVVSKRPTPAAHPLGREEKMIIDLLKEHEPKLLKDLRSDGYTDKEIARYFLDHTPDDEEP